MSNFTFVAYLVDRFSPVRTTIALCSHDGATSIVDLPDLCDCEGPLVTHDVPLLIEAFRLRGVSLPTTMIDLTEALKLRSQISRDQGGQKLWNIWRLSGEHFEDPEDAKTIEKLFAAKVATPLPSELNRLVCAASLVLNRLWNETKFHLRELGEWERFLTKEVPVQQIFHRRQYAGIRIDDSNVLQHIKSCENEKYSAFRMLSKRLGFAVTGMTGRKIAEKLFSDSRDLPANVSGFDLIEDYLEIARDRLESAQELLSYIESTRDLSILRQLHTESGRLHPIFQTHGTITSRILVTEPRLQQLRKRYRSVLQADEGMELVYLDYAQFEPGIIAALSKDTDLLKAYESSDLYLSLSMAIYGHENSRDTAKRIFLAYCYGMSKTRIAELLIGLQASAGELERYEELVNLFFSRFPQVETLRRDAQAKLMSAGRVSSLMGNFRRRLSDGELSSKEERWAMNHIVQGTASLIFKEALIRLADRFEASSIILPMHDAVLMQFSPKEISRDVFESVATGIMRDAYTSYFPEISPKVSVAAFGA